MNESIENIETKECPYCAETILKKAKKCRYCSSVIENSFSDTGNNTHKAGGIHACFQIKKKWLGLITAVFFLVFCGYEFYKEAEDNNDCELAKISDTKESWKEYIEKQADGRCILLAESRIKEKTREESIKRKSLIWSAQFPEEMNWSDAKEYCLYLDEGNYSDWRLPTIKELKTIIINCYGTERCEYTDDCLSGSCHARACEGCFGTSDDHLSFSGMGFWSSTERSVDTASYLLFNSGRVSSYDKHGGNYVRCVRSP